MLSIAYLTCPVKPNASSSVKSNYGEVIEQFKNLTEIIAT